MANRYFFILALLLNLTGLYRPLQAQEPETQYFTPEIYLTRTDSLSATELISRFDTELFQPTATFGKSTARDIYWIKLDLSKLKGLSEHKAWAAYFGSSDKGTLYYHDTNGTLSERNFGFLNSDKPFTHSVLDRHLMFESDELIDGRYLLVRYQRLTSSHKMADFTVLLKTFERLKMEQPAIDLSRLKNLTTSFIFTGIGGIVLLFALSSFIIQKRKEYLFYSLYLLALLMYFGRRAFIIHGFGSMGLPMLDYTLHMELQVLINLSYVLFARYFLNTPKDYPALDKWIKFVVIALSIFIVADLILIWFEQFGIHFTAINVQRYFMATFGFLASIWLLIKRKSTLVYFIVIGSFSYTIGALGTLFLSENDYMITGSAIEIFIFTLGLGYKSRDLIRKNAQIGQEVLQLEMKALRAQMNPHFIFNSLGSIQHLVRTDKSQEAMQYLSSFSSLLRQILESAREGTVTVEEEAALLRNYISLEALRFEQGFEYSVTVDPALDSHNLEIPILLIQPHVENAILHGLLPKDEDARLTVQFLEEANHVVCMVEDNGVGREKSAELKSKRGVQHKSHGLGIVKDRLDHLKSGEDSERLVQIDDIVNDLGMPGGTQVTIRIPKEY